MTLTPQESTMLTEFVKDGHVVEEIIQSSAEFRIRGRHKDGCAYYGRAVVYDLAACIRETQEAILRFRRENRH